MANARRLAALWGLVVLQILAAIWLWWPRQHGPVTGTPWLHLTPSAVTDITLTRDANGHEKTLTLEKQDGHWQLPHADGFPADAPKVNRLLTALAGLKGTLPVAVTENAAKRFHVAAHEFETRVTLDAGSKRLARVYVGNAAGADLVYLRRAGSPTIESNRLPSWLLSTSASDWRDESVLQLPTGSIDKLVLPHVTLTRAKTGWSAAGGSATLDQGKVKHLVNQIAQLDFLDVVGRKPTTAAPATFDVSIDAHGKMLHYAFDKVSLPPAKDASSKSKPKARVGWHLTRSGLPYVFAVSSDTVKALQDATVQSLASPATAQKTNKKAKAPAPTAGSHKKQK